MRKVTMATGFCFAALVFSACIGKATPEEINKMCEHHAHLTGTDQVPAKDELVADVDRMFTQLEKDVKASRDLEIKQLTEDINARIEAAKDDAEKTSLKENLDAKTKQLDEKLALDLAAFTPRRAEELAKVDEKIKTAQGEKDAALKKCVDKATSDGILKNLVDCRIKAETLDKYNNVCY